MEQIIQNIQISKYDTSGTENKSILIDKKYTLDNPIFENSGKLNIPKGESCEFHQLNDVNYIYLYSTCPFNLLINNLVVINTTQFSFVNRNKTISVAIETNSEYDLTIDFVYGTLKSGQQDIAAKQIIASNRSSVKWDRVLKNIILQANDTNTVEDFGYTNSNTTDANKFVTCSNFDQALAKCQDCRTYFETIPDFSTTNRFPCYSRIYNQNDNIHSCQCDTAAIHAIKSANTTMTNDGRVRYITRRG